MSLRSFARSPRAAARVAAATLAMMCTLAASRAFADCTYYAGDTTGTNGTAGSPTIVELMEDQPTWSVFAVRPQAADDWDLVLYQNFAAAPACVASPLASSSYGVKTVDLVVGDYAHDPLGLYYVSVNQFSGPNQGLLRWSKSSQVLPLNGLAVNRSWSAIDVMEKWNVTLTAGVNYTIAFNRSAGIDAKLLLFGNPGGGTYWAGRASALLSLTAPGTFTPAASGTYALVVVNDDGGTGTFSLGIGACTPPLALSSGVPVHTTRADDFFQFTQNVPYWTVIGARSGSADYDVYVDGNTAGAGFPNCLADPKAISSGVGLVDFVIGDFNYNPQGTYYMRAHDFAGPEGADVEWDSGADVLTVDAAPVARTTGPGNVLEAWDVLLSAGQTYNFAFNGTGSHTHLLLFRNPGASVFWASRGGAEFDVTGCTTYAASSTGYYGVVVVNDTGELANFTLGVSLSPCTCPTVLAANTPTMASSPNGYFSCTTSLLDNVWSVVATRGVNNADDFDLSVSGAATGNPAPACFGPTLTASSFGAGTVDIGVIDFNQVPTGTYFARTSHFSGGGAFGVAEFDDSHGVLAFDGPVMHTSMSTIDLAHAWEAYLVAGVAYTVQFQPSDPSLRLLVFENPGSSSYFVSRTAAVATTSTTITYTPLVTGFHGFIVVNDLAVNATYDLRVGSCNVPFALTSGVSQFAPYAVNVWSFAQASPGWAGIGVRSGVTDNDIAVSASQTGTFPNCLGPQLAGSFAGTSHYVDFVVADFFHTPLATYDAQSYQFPAGAGDPSEVEWDSGGGEVLPNDNNDVSGTTGATDVMHVWSTFLTAGQAYQLTFTTGGAATQSLLLYRNAGGGAYWTARSASVVSISGSGTAVYNAPASGEYGIVVVNDDGGAGSYAFNLKTCSTPTALASGVATVDAPENFHTINQTAPYWTAIGVRSTSDWDIDLNSSGAGGAPGVCQSGPLATSSGVGVVDFIVGDFNAGGNAPGTYFVRDHRFSGAATGAVEWDSGTDLINVGGGLTHRSTGAGNVLETWDVRLSAGQTYAVYFSHTGAADVKVMLFRNPGGAYWAPRFANVYANTVSGNFTAPATGYYGLVVVNDNGSAGTYDVGVYGSALAAPATAAVQSTELRAVQPNPAREGMRVEYALSERAPVRVQMLDLAGRVVAEMENGTREAGVWQAGWNGLTRSGGRAAPGVYMVRLQVDGRTIGQRKVTVLE